MKALTTTCILIGAIGLSTPMKAQLPVSTTPQKKKALIEEFTGIYCGYCPDGHKIAQDLMKANPGKVYAINIHTGGYAKPQANPTAKDFRTTDGDAIAALPNMGITGYPTGAVNRYVFNGTTKITVGRNNWTGICVPTILNQNAYVNVAGRALINPTTKLLTVEIEAYYTGASPQATNKLTVALLQDNIDGYQAGSDLNPTQVNSDGTYKHMHALRDLLTASAGDDISPTTVGSKITKTYTYTLPTAIPTGVTKNIPVVLEDLSILVYVSELSAGTNTINVAEVPITIGTSFPSVNINEQKEILTNVALYPNPVINNCNVNFNILKDNDVTISVVNALGQEVQVQKLGTLNAGEHDVDLNLSSLDNGIYFVKIVAGDYTTIEKLSVEH